MDGEIRLTTQMIVWEVRSTDLMIEWVAGEVRLTDLMIERVAR